MTIGYAEMNIERMYVMLIAGFISRRLTNEKPAVRVNDECANPTYNPEISSRVLKRMKNDIWTNINNNWTTNNNFVCVAEKKYNDIRVGAFRMYNSGFGFTKF